MEVVIVDPTQVIFEGKADSVILPGEKGVFEVLPFHKNFLSRLITGSVSIDRRSFSIRRGIVKVENDIVTIIAEGVKKNTS